jgi:hypothetical protein
MTMGCARCHDHKYDPISQRDFYRFFAFFNTIAEKGLDGRRGNAEPMIRVSTIGQEVELDNCDCALRDKRDDFPEAEAKRSQAAWEAERIESPIAEVKEGIEAHFRFDDDLNDSSGAYHRARKHAGDSSFGAGMIGRAASLQPDDHFSLGKIARFEKDRPFGLAVWIRPTSDKAFTILERIEPAWQLAAEESYHIPELKRGTRLLFTLGNAWDGIRIRTREPIILGQWVHVAVNYYGDRLEVFLNGEPAEVDALPKKQSIHKHKGPILAGELQLGPTYGGSIDDLRVFGRTLAPEEISRLAIHMPADSLVEVAEVKRTKEERGRLREYFLTHAAPQPLRVLHAEVKALEKRKEEMERAIPTTMVMREMDKPRGTFILARGQYDAPTENVTPGVPSILPPLPEGVAPTRLALARWLVDPSHPLTSRVAVNRFWQIYFGTGIVKTAEDFGSQGEPPSHPQLLDWLATEFINSGWDMKALQRLIVTSAAYRQSSRVTPELLARDPDNRLIARMSRFRLPAELVRDSALAVSSLLKPEIGGPSVFPYQPPGLWEEMAFHGVYSAQTYHPSKGRDLYRRSMYTFWKRTVPPASQGTFDAPDREKCTARRSVTNTPLQALVLMNDPTYIEAARVLAQRVLQEARLSVRDRLTLAFRLVTLRKPTAREVAILGKLLQQQTAHFQANAEYAQQLVGIGDSQPGSNLDRIQLAAWTNVASVLLSMDESITKE